MTSVTAADGVNINVADKTITAADGNPELNYFFPHCLKNTNHYQFFQNLTKSQIATKLHTMFPFAELANDNIIKKFFLLGKLHICFYYSFLCQLTMRLILLRRPLQCQQQISIGVGEDAVGNTAAGWIYAHSWKRGSA